MGDQMSCYRCGHSLEVLPLPLGRRDECPGCTADLHVCRMCRMYDRREPTGCTEEDALEVTEKERANFCDYFKPSDSAYDASFSAGEQKAKGDLTALLGDGDEAGPAEDGVLGDADKLFK